MSEHYEKSKELASKMSEISSEAKKNILEWAKKLEIEVKIGTKQEYDDNNYYTSYEFTEIDLDPLKKYESLNLIDDSVNMEEYHIDEYFDVSLEAIKEIELPNSMDMIVNDDKATDGDKLARVLKDNQLLEEHSENNVGDAGVFNLVANILKRGLDPEDVKDFLYTVLELNYGNSLPHEWIAY